MPRRTTELNRGEFYHVYNRGANRAPIFFERENYLFFCGGFEKNSPPITPHPGLLLDAESLSLARSS